MKVEKLFKNFEKEVDLFNKKNNINNYQKNNQKINKINEINVHYLIFLKEFLGSNNVKKENVENLLKSLNNHYELLKKINEEN